MGCEKHHLLAFIDMILIELAEAKSKNDWNRLERFLYGLRERVLYQSIENIQKELGFIQ